MAEKKEVKDKVAKKVSLDAVIRQVNKKYGDNTIITANRYPKLPRFSTGILALDLETGGGVPKGRMTMFFGQESTGKSLVAQMTVISAQHTCRNCDSPMFDGICSGCDNGAPYICVYEDVEGTFDTDWFVRLGGDLEALTLCQPEFTEQSIDITEAIIRTGEVDLIVIDSLAMLSPMDELAKSAEDQLVGTHAKLLNRMMRAISSGFNSLGMMNKRKPAVIMVNQLREKVGVNYGSPETLTGGQGQKFAASIRVKFFARPSERVYESVGDKNAIGQVFRFNVEKNKTFTPHREGMYTLYTADSEEFGVSKGDIDTLNQIVTYGVHYGVISGSTWLSYPDIITTADGEIVSEEIIKAQGQANFLKELKQRPDTCTRIIEQVRQAIVKGAEVQNADPICQG